jgi:predicted peroxiredoxin
MSKMGYSFDPLNHITQAKSAGVKLYAAAVWCDFLGIREKLPPEIELLEIPELTKLIAEAKRIIGGP